MFDLHLHSLHSFDGDASVLDICAKAAESSLLGIAITDHIDLASNTDFFPDFTPAKHAKTAKASFEKTTDARSVYSGRLEVLRGIELGQALHNPGLSEFLLETYDYDFVLGSIHNLRGTDDFYFMRYDSPAEAGELLGEYFDELHDLVSWGQFDSLAHLTYPLRYMVGRDKIALDLSKFDEKIDAILSLLAEKNKALEINCSGLRQEIAQTLPSEKYIRRFRELGGRHITIGSDAHRLPDIGFGLFEGAHLAQKCGFESFTVFRGRLPFEVKF